MNTLRDRLGREVLIGDGAMGTWLLSQGITAYDLPLLPLTNPEALTRTHLAYLQAGAQLLETHTFAATAGRLALLGHRVPVQELHRRAAQIARHARDIHGSESYVLGSLGPLAAPVDSVVVPGLEFSDAVAQYHEAVSGLLAGGVDAFIVETMSDLKTIRAAVTAIRQETDLPVMVSLTFSRLGTTLYGLAPEDTLDALGDLPGGLPDAIGANCGTGPSLALDAVLRMMETAQKHHLPVSVYPNAGEPYRLDGSIAYPATPQYLGTLGPALRAAGAAVIGGCCGTTPDHIRVLAESLKRAETHEPGPAPVLVLSDEVPKEPEETAPRETLVDLLAKTFVVSVELDPPRGVNLDRFIALAQTVAHAGAAVINIADSPMARVRLSALAAARLILEAVPVQPLLHFTTRDRNLMGIQSDLLGAHALGLRNILALTGDPPGLGDYAHATAVYDIDSVGLVRVLDALNHGHDALGQAIGVATHFAIGVGVNPTADDLAREIRRLEEKQAAGAQYCLTQPIYSPEQLYRFLDAWGPRTAMPLILGVMPLVSYRQASYLSNEVPGITIPDFLLYQMQDAADAEKVGVESSIQLLEKLRSLIQGVYLVPSFNRVGPLLPILEWLLPGRNGSDLARHDTM